MTTERPACGLGSLLSMSCRDRAEAFARSLQSRLQTLGLGSPDEPPPTESEPSASPPAGSLDAAAPGPGPGPGSAPADASVPPPPPPGRPPLRLGSSSDSDLYYDFDLEPESPASPAEEALELVVAQQPRGAAPAAPVEPESGVTSSFFGTSPGSDSSDSFEPDAFVSPSTSPAWFTARRRPSYEKCNGHATPLLQNGSAHPPREYGSVHAPKEEKATHRENGSAHAPGENGSAHAPTLNGSTHQMIENGCERPVWERDSLQTVLSKEHAQTVLGNGYAHSITENGSAPTALENGSEHTVLNKESAHTVLEDESTHTVLGNGSAELTNEDDVTWCQRNNFSLENMRNSASYVPENKDVRGQNNIVSANDDEAVNIRNTLNRESENESERLTDIIRSLDGVTVNETDNGSDHMNTDNDGAETESGLNSDNMFNESSSLYIPHEEEIELLPSDTFARGTPFNTRDKDDDDPDSGFRFNDDWEDRFSDYSPEDGYAGEDEMDQRKEGDKEDREISKADTNLSTWPSDSSYKSTFCTEANLTLECSPEALKSERLEDERIPSVLEELGVLPRRPSWEEIQKNVPGLRLTSTLIINQEDDLKHDVQVPEISSSENVEQRPEDEKDETTATTVISETSAENPPCCSPPPQVICDHTPDDDDESESDEESSRDEDAEKLKPEPRRRRRPQDEQSPEEDEDSPRQRLRRCSSLKTGKTPPGTPHRKKIVRFADVLGLDLADVRTFMDEIPRIPSSAYDDLPDADLSLGSLANPVVAGPPVDPAFSAVAGPDPSAAMSLSLCAPCKTLVPTFQQPGGQPDFLERIRTRFVCLENAVINDVATSSIAGMVRVRNLDFHKSVYVRYSIDGWKSYSDLQATYVPSSCDGFSDKFSFVLFAHTLTVGQRLEFAIRFQCKGTQYWDSNGGANYGFQCLPATSPAPYMPLPSPEDRWGSFY